MRRTARVDAWRRRGGPACGCGTRRSGFTLMETITAVIILSVAVPPMLWAVRESQAERVNPMLVSKAGWLAMQTMEEIIADRHSATRGYTWLTTANFNANYSTAKGAIAGFLQFSRSVTFTETKADLVTAGGGYTKVTVAVSWSDWRGNARTMTIYTVVTEYDPV